jgi:lipoprotein LprG
VHRLLIICLLAALTGLSATACTGDDDESGASPAQVADRLKAAKRLLDQAGSVRLTLRTDRLPEGVNGITKAAGVATHAPAFRGTITVAAPGLFDGQSVDVVAVDGVVYAQTPFSSSFIRVDPADFNAPDPATLMQSDRGLSTLLTEATDLAETDQRRDGKDIVSTYTGSVPGTAVAGIFPSASGDRPFDVTFTVDQDDRLRGAQVTGPFYRNRPAVTYHVGVFPSAQPVEITAP